MWRKSKGCWCSGKNRSYFEHGSRMLHERGSIFSVRRCFLPACEGVFVLKSTSALQPEGHNMCSKLTIQTARTKSQIDICIFFFCSEHWANRCGNTSSSRVPLWVSSHNCLAISRRRLGPPCVPAVTFVFRQHMNTMRRSQQLLP